MKKFSLFVLLAVLCSGVILGENAVVVRYETFISQGHKVTCWRKLCPTGAWEYVEYDGKTNSWWHLYNSAEFSIGADGKTNFNHANFQTALAYSTNNAPHTTGTATDCSQ